MDTVQQYILSIVCVCMLCFMLQTLFSGNPHMTPLIKMITGLVLSLTVLMPFFSNRLLEFDIEMKDIASESEAAVTSGELAARESMSAIIKEKTESYILEKANTLGMDIQAEVTLTEEDLPLPYKVAITGTVTPYARKQMGEYLQQNIGIPEENQIWNSQN